MGGGEEKGVVWAWLRLLEGGVPRPRGGRGLPKGFYCTQPLGRARGDEPQGRWRGDKGSGRGCVEAVQCRARGENIKKFFFTALMNLMSSSPRTRRARGPDDEAAYPPAAPGGYSYLTPREVCR
eukprot:scaffold119532_cov22-Tisochrysis_lutea.AAC.1